MNDNIQQGFNETGVLGYNTDVIPENTEKISKIAKMNTKIKILERNNENNVNRKLNIKKSVKSDKTKAIAVKIKDPSINPDDDDTYFTHVSPKKNVKERMNNQDKELKDTLLKAKEFIKTVQKNNSFNAKFIERQVICEEKLNVKEENIDDNDIDGVDVEPIVDLVEKYENLNKKEKNEENKNEQLKHNNIPNNIDCIGNNDKIIHIINHDNTVKTNNKEVVDSKNMEFNKENCKNITSNDNISNDKDTNILNVADNNSIIVADNNNLNIEIKSKIQCYTETAQLTSKVNINDDKFKKEKVTKGESNSTHKLNVYKDNSNSNNRNSINNNKNSINNNQNKNHLVDKNGELQKNTLNTMNKQIITKKSKPEIKKNNDDIQDLIL